MFQIKGTLPTETKAIQQQRHRSADKSMQLISCIVCGSIGSHELHQLVIRDSHSVMPWGAFHLYYLYSAYLIFHKGHVQARQKHSPRIPVTKEERSWIYMQTSLYCHSATASLLFILLGSIPNCFQFCHRFVRLKKAIHSNKLRVF